MLIIVLISVIVMAANAPQVEVILVAQVSTLTKIMLEIFKFERPEWDFRARTDEQNIFMLL